MMKLCKQCLKTFKQSKEGKVFRTKHLQLGSNWRHYLPESLFHSETTKLCNFHNASHKALNSKRRAWKLNATPPWADLNKIRDIYMACPEGCHVDHIVPLKGSKVCGLHVENNLQYLTAKENIQKKN